MNERVLPLGPTATLVRGRDGLFLANPNDLYIGRSLIEYGEFSFLEMKVIEQLVRAGDTVLEVGANIGAHTVGLAKRVGRNGKVIAVEPQPLIFHHLCANLALNGITNTETHGCGMGRAEQTLYLPRIRYDCRGNFGGVPLETSGSIAVDVKRIDDVFGDQTLKLIKVDVEGMEADVLEGARETIQRCKPHLYLENDRRDKSESLIRLIIDMGYQLWRHAPRLFNPENFFENAEDRYAGIVSLNMICIHRDHNAEMHGFEAITDPTIPLIDYGKP